MRHLFHKRMTQKISITLAKIFFQSLQDFFKTGRNPTHNWTEKGDWKCTYFLNDKDLPEEFSALKEKAENFTKEDVKENSEKKEESIDPKKRESYKTKRKKFFNKNRFKDNKRPKKKEASPSKEIS